MYGYIPNNQMIFFMETVQILWRQRKLNFPVTFHWHANQIRVCASAQTPISWFISKGSSSSIEKF